MIVTEQFMATIGSPLDRLQSEAWAKAEGIIRDFEKALQRGEAPQIESYLLVDGDERLPLLSELIHAELEHWIKDGKAVRVESYLVRFPELRQDARSVLSLIISEYRFRQELDGAVNWREFVSRFPDLSETIQNELGSMEVARATPPSTRVNDQTTDQPNVPEISISEAQTIAPPSIVSNDPGTQIGPYKLIRKIGEGGMGAVYLAEQEQPVRRQVALKVIRPGLNNAHVLGASKQNASPCP